MRSAGRLRLAFACALAIGLGAPSASCLAQADAGFEETLRNAAAPGGSGAQRVLAGRRITPLTYREAMQRGLRQNLSLQFQRQVSLEAGAAVLGTQAVFDPVTGLSASWTRNTSYDRAEVITRVRRLVPDFETFQAQFQASLQNAAQTGSQPDIAACSVIVDGQKVLNGFAAARPECANSPSTLSENASSRGLVADETLAFTALGSKLFDFGGLLSLSLRSAYNPRQSPFVGVTGTDVAFIPRNLAYVSTLSVGFTTPLPFGKNFGAYGTQQATDKRLAEARSLRAGFEYESVANSTLLAADNAYWDLVGNLRVLQITLEQRSILEQMRKRARAFYQLGEINEYSMNQVEARLAGTLGRETLAWNGLVAASESLSNLLNGDILELLLPVAYQETLEQTPGVELGAAIRSGLARNADIKRGEILLEESRIALNHRLNDVKPDVLFSAGLTLGQSNQFFGYRSYAESLQNLFSPDLRTYTIGVTLRVPIGNAAAKAALSQARVGVMQAHDQLTQSRSLVVQQVSASMDSLQSGLKQIELSRINAKLAEDAFEAAARRRALNLISDFALLEVQNDLLNARLGHVDALVNYRKSVGRHLASQNLLAGSFRE